MGRGGEEVAFIHNETFLEFCVCDGDDKESFVNADVH